MNPYDKLAAVACNLNFEVKNLTENEFYSQWPRHFNGVCLPIETKPIIFGQIHISTETFQNETNLIYTLAHEVGHAMDFQNPDFIMDLIKPMRRIRQGFGTIGDKLKSFAAEISAYKNADKVLNKLDIKIDNVEANRVRHGCLNAYKVMYGL